MSSVTRIYLVRGIVAIGWAVAIHSFGGTTLTPALITLLVGYPLIDVVASLLDVREMAETRARKLQVFNAALSTLAAIGLGVGAIAGIGTVLFIFGLWAVVSGVAQFIVAIRRRHELGFQWASLLAGGLSVIAGLSYLPSALGEAPSLSMLVLYASVGGAWFVLQAITLVVRSRRLPPAGARQGFRSEVGETVV